MTIRTTKNRCDPMLLDATLKYSSGLFQFLVGITREQLEILERRKTDEQEIREIADSKWGVRLPSLATA